MTRVVVTGANGFIGFHTVKGLLTEGYEVVAVDIKTDKLQNISNVEIHKIDILDPELKNSIRENDIVLHLAAVAHRADVDERPMLGFSVNVLGTLNVILSSLEKRAEKLVFSSTGSVYSKSVQIPIKENAERKPHNLYGLSKKMAEDLIFLFSDQLNYIILRYGYVYGLMKGRGAVYNFLKRIREKKSPIVFGGTQTNDFVYVKDIVKANILACKSPYNNQVYNIGTGRAINILDVAQECLRITNSTLEIKREPYRWIDYPAFVYDISKAETLLGYEPEWDLYSGIKDMVEQHG